MIESLAKKVIAIFTNKSCGHLGNEAADKTKKKRKKPVPDDPRFQTLQVHMSPGPQPQEWTCHECGKVNGSQFFIFDLNRVEINIFFFFKWLNFSFPPMQ